MKKEKEVTPGQRFLSSNQAADWAGLHPGTLANKRAKKQGCPYYKRGGKILYDKNEFENWLRANRVQTIDGLKQDSNG
jgi:hypothetical protein